MISRNSSVYLVGLMLLMTLNEGCQMRGTDSHNALGAVEIRDEQIIKGPWPIELPRTFYVSDFTLDAQQIKGNQGVLGILHGRRFGQNGQRLPHPRPKLDPDAQAREIIHTMNQSLIKSFRDKGFTAQHRQSGPQRTLPHYGWLLQGIFTEVDEGNRIKRAVIGFGHGATKMDVQVGVSKSTE